MDLNFLLSRYPPVAKVLWDRYQDFYICQFVFHYVVKDFLL